jgi:threonine dehydrogenase-like Zn-dependent dehydrogenase
VVAVLGAGTLGLTVTAALAHMAANGRCPAPRSLLVGAKYPHQQRLAREFGATDALPADQLPRAVRRQTHSLSFGGVAGETATLSGGADVVIDCVGSAESISQSLSMVRPRGTVALVGMPGKVTIDLAPLWHREVRLAGAYAYGTESVPGMAATGAAATGARKRPAAKPKEVTTFALAFDVVAAASTGRLVSATYPLARFEEAVAHAGAAGRRGAVKIAFDIRKGHTR